MSRDHKPECGWYWDGRACICETQEEKSMFKRRMTRKVREMYMPSGAADPADWKNS